MQTGIRLGGHVLKSYSTAPQISTVLAARPGSIRAGRLLLLQAVQNQKATILPMDRKSLVKYSIIFRDQPEWNDDTPTSVAELYALLGLAPRGAEAVKAIEDESGEPELCRVIKNWAVSLVDLNATQRTWSQFYAHNYIAPLKKQTNGAGRVAEL